MAIAWPPSQTKRGDIGIWVCRGMDEKVAMGARGLV